MEEKIGKLNKPMKKKVVIIGSGNVATFMARKLRKAGNAIVQIYSRNGDAAWELAQASNAEAVSEISKISSKADLYVIAVKDDAIQEVSDALNVDGGIVVHTSGTAPIETLKKHNATGILYPYQTVRKEESPERLQMCVMFDGNSDDVTEIIEEFAFQLSDYTTRVTDAERRVYHLAAVLVNNFSNHLVVLANELLEKHALDTEYLKPIIMKTAEIAVLDEPFESQTGPARRGDETTIQLHQQMLADNPILAEIYSKITESIKQKYR